ncbi:hypothetical protein P0F65_21325 [Sphingomonas sp. I4]
MRAVRFALIFIALVMAGAQLRAASKPAMPIAYMRAIDAAKGDMLRDPAMAMRRADTARVAARGIADGRQRALALATADWLHGEGRFAWGGLTTPRTSSPERSRACRRWHRNPI